MTEAVFYFFSQKQDRFLYFANRICECIYIYICIMQNSNIYHWESGIAQGGCSSSMLADLFLYHYEKKFTNNNNIHFFRYIDIIIFFRNHTQCILPVNYPSYLSFTKKYSNL